METEIKNTEDYSHGIHCMAHYGSISLSLIEICTYVKIKEHICNVHFSYNNVM